MKGWPLAVGVFSISGAMVCAALLSLRAQASAESASNALVLAERAQLAKEKSTLSPSAAAPSAPAVSTTPAVATPNVSFHATTTYNGAPVYVPAGCSGPYDVLLHFHGIHSYVRDHAVKSNLRAVVAVFNSGNGAEKYAQAYQAPGALSSLLKQVALAAAPLCVGVDAAPRRIALSGFSAGYAAVEKLLTRAEDRDRVDAALLADGLHAGFTDVWKRQMAPNALQAFRDFGELAKQGQKLFAITHSSIATDGYASTTECSRYLLNALHVPCEDALVSGKSGAFSIEGFTGNDKAAHIVQFRQMDRTLLTKLVERWTK